MTTEMIADEAAQGFGGTLIRRGNFIPRSDFAFQPLLDGQEWEKAWLYIPRVSVPVLPNMEQECEISVMADEAGYAKKLVARMREMRNFRATYHVADSTPNGKGSFQFLQCHWVSILPTTHNWEDRETIQKYNIKLRITLLER